MATKIANRDAAAFIAQRAEFTSHTGSFRGTGINSYAGLQAGPGVMPEPHRSTFRAARPVDHRPGLADGDVLYVVFSYATPIAWYTRADGWVIPPVKYSATTSRHQSIVRRAIAQGA